MQPRHTPFKGWERAALQNYVTRSYPSMTNETSITHDVARDDTLLAVWLSMDTIMFLTTPGEQCYTSKSHVSHHLETRLYALFAE